jgi:type IV pilus assembly protein PilM
MSVLTRRSRNSPIGVAIDADAVRMLQLEWRGDSGVVLASAEIERDPGVEDVASDGALAAKIDEALSARGFKGRRAVVALPSDLVVERHVKVDSTEGQALHDALLFELEPSFPGDVPIVQHLDVGEVVERGEKRHELILLAAGVKPTRELLGWLERAELEPVALDVQSCALIRCFMRRRRRGEDQQTQTAIVHIGSRATLMTITVAGHPMFMKQLPLGSEPMIETLSQRLDLTAEELRVTPGEDHDVDEETELAPHVVNALRLAIDSLALELSACLRYHAASRRGLGAMELFLTGPGAEIPGLAKALGEALGQSISRPDPFCQTFSGVTADARVARRFPLWTVPLGLALRDLEP